ESTNGAGQTTRYLRDVLGQVVAQDTDGVPATFEYDVAGRLVRAANPDAEVRFELDPVGRVLAETCNGRTLTSSYDAAGRRVYRRTPSGAECRWAYRADGRLAALQTAGRLVRFGYDEGGREVARRVGPVLLTQTFDAASRLRSQVLTAGGLDPEQPARLVRRRAYAYRAEGSAAAVEDRLAGPRRYGLDAAGRVTAVDAPGWSERYGYAPAGNLVGAAGPPGVRPEDGPREYAGTLLRAA